MASFILSFINRFFLFLFINFGCFSTSSARRHPHDEIEPPSKRKKITPFSSSTFSPNKSLLSCSILSYLNHLLSFRKPDQNPATPPQSKNVMFSHAPSRTDIFPCSACGEVLTKPQHLHLHQATKHSLSELRDGDSGKNIVRIIFSSGWRGSNAPKIHQVLKIHNSAKTLARFEEYREIVRTRAAPNCGDERCIADGNERLRFYCSTILCHLGSHVGACGSSYCSTCAIVRHGFGNKQADLEGIATHATGWGAHVSLPEELESEFAFMQVRRAVLVCRVVAGRVARGGEEKEGAVNFDSVSNTVGHRGRASSAAYVEEEELLVFNPTAVLPCFVIIYSA